MWYFMFTFKQISRPGGPVKKPGEDFMCTNARTHKKPTLSPRLSTRLHVSATCDDPNVLPEIAQALVNTVAPTAQQLSLSPGQLIVVLAKNSTGWWLGELQVGLHAFMSCLLHFCKLKYVKPKIVKP
jgi:hypothetical protein